MKSTLLIILIFVNFDLAIAKIGGDVGNGGDAVLCRPSSINRLKGYYSLDYLAQYQPELDMVLVKDLNESLNRIESQFKKKLPELLPNFQSFRKNIFNITDATQIHFWEKSQFGLIDLKDESFLSVLPENCRNGKNVSIVQAVIRVNPQFSGRPLNHYLYRFVPEVIAQLNANNPVQLSFLIVHEWLWDLSDNVDRNRRLNYWLHSSLLELWSREEMIQNLSGIGFKIPTLPDPVFSAESCPADKQRMKALFAKARERYSNPRTLILGYGKSYVRNKYCDRSKNACNNYFSDGFPMTYSARPRFEFQPHIGIELFRNGLLVRSQVSGSKPVEHFTCPLDLENETIGVCTTLEFTPGFPFEPQVSFKTVLGKNCFRLSAQNEINIGIPNNPNFYAMMEYVLYYPTIEF